MFSKKEKLIFVIVAITAFVVGICAANALDVLVLQSEFFEPPVQKSQLPETGICGTPLLEKPNYIFNTHLLIRPPYSVQKSMCYFT